MRNFNRNDFIAIDFETANYAPESAISIGLVKFRDYKPIGSYYSLIRPPRLYIRPDFTEIHGLTVEDIKDAPDFEYLWKTELQAFFNTVPFVAHQAVFDMKILRCTLKYYNIPVPELNYFCSLKLSRQVWPDLDSHSLSALAEKFDIKYNAHNALADAETCGKIVALCAEEYCGSGNKENLPLIETVLEKAGLELEVANCLNLEV